MLRTMTLLAALSLPLLALAPAPAQATSMYIPPPSSCTLDYCDPGTVACYQWWCVDTSYIDVTCSSDCFEAYYLACSMMPKACYVVGELAQTPVGTCTFEYCGWDDDACVTAGKSACYDIPPVDVPAACVGTMCESEGTACVWTEWTPDGLCDTDFVVCGPMTCGIVAVNMGACLGSPQSYYWDDPNYWENWESMPYCEGGIACMDGPNAKKIDTDWCIVFYVVA